MTKRLFVAFSYEDALALANDKQEHDHVLLFAIDPKHNIADLPYQNAIVVGDYVSTVSDNMEFYAQIHAAYRNQIEQIKTKHPIIWEYANTILVNLVYRIGLIIYKLQAQLDQFNYQEVIIYGQEYHKHFPVFGAEGEVVSRFQYFPMLLYTSYLIALCKQHPVPYRLANSQALSFLTPLKLAFRDITIDTGKLLYLLRQRFQARKGSFLFSEKMPLVKEDYDLILLLRNEIGASFFASFVHWAGTHKKKKILLICDEMLQRIGCLTMVKKLYPKLPYINLLKHQSMATLIKEWFKNRFRSATAQAQETLQLATPNVQFSIPIKPIEIHLMRSMIDKQLRKTVLDKVLKALPKKQASVLSGEMVSVDATLEANLCQKHGFKYWNAEVASCDPLEAIREAPGEGFLASSHHEANIIAHHHPDEAHKIYHIGLFRFPEFSLEVSNTSTNLKTVTFFTQPPPLPSHENIGLLEVLNELAYQLGFKVVVKPHPRDTTSYERFATSPNVVLQPRIGVLSTDLIKASDLVVARISSTLQESLFIGVPYIAFNTDLKGILKWDFLHPSLGVAVSSLHQLNDTIKNYNLYKNSFFEKRENFLKEATEPAFRFIF